MSIGLSRFWLFVDRSFPFCISVCVFVTLNKDAAIILSNELQVHRAVKVPKAVIRMPERPPISDSISKRVNTLRSYAIKLNSISKVTLIHTLFGFSYGKTAFQFRLNKSSIGVIVQSLSIIRSLSCNSRWICQSLNGIICLVMVLMGRYSIRDSNTFESPKYFY